MASASSGSFEASPASSAPSSASESSSVNPAIAAEKLPDDTSKLRMFLGILRKYVFSTERGEPTGSCHATPLSSVACASLFPPPQPQAGPGKFAEYIPREHLLILPSFRRFIGVADIASVRFSLPAQLLEPTPNLEYWNYLDQPNTFIAIGDSDDALDRMLEVLRFWCTKDLKYVKGKPCKPYNSALGEFFRV